MLMGKEGEARLSGERGMMIGGRREGGVVKLKVEQQTE
jgi:hypothetical protein